MYYGLGAVQEGTFKTIGSTLYVFKNGRWVRARAEDKAAASQPGAVFAQPSQVGTACTPGTRRRDYTSAAKEQSPGGLSLVCGEDGKWVLASHSTGKPLTSFCQEAGVPAAYMDQCVNMLNSIGGQQVSDSKLKSEAKKLAKEIKEAMEQQLTLDQLRAQKRRQLIMYAIAGGGALVLGLLLTDKKGKRS